MRILFQLFHIALFSLYLYLFVVHFVPGMYAIQVIGVLPDDILDYCDSNGFVVRSIAKAVAK